MPEIKVSMQSCCVFSVSHQAAYHYVEGSSTRKTDTIIRFEGSEDGQSSLGLCPGFFAVNQQDKNEEVKK